MTDLLTASRDAFLAEVSKRVAPKYKEVAFAEILDALSRWSREPGRELEVREPGKQHTVSFGVRRTGDVLWAAYPRSDDGAKVVVLPRRFQHLTDGPKGGLLEQHAVAVPGARVEGTGTLECPMHLLASDRALTAYLELLAMACRVSLAAA